MTRCSVSVQQPQHRGAPNRISDSRHRSACISYSAESSSPTASTKASRRWSGCALPHREHGCLGSAKIVPRIVPPPVADRLVLLRLIAWVAEPPSEGTGWGAGTGGMRGLTPSRGNTCSETRRRVGSTRERIQRASAVAAAFESNRERWSRRVDPRVSPDAHGPRHRDPGQSLGSRRPLGQCGSTCAPHRG
jgi:hypothetical protein